MAKFDFVVPLGATCITAHNVRSCGLQKESLPFDWIWISGLPMITGFLSENFSGFMLKENLRFLRNNGDADIYRDELTKTEFWHDFMAGQDFDASYDANYPKYQRRICRLYDHLNRSRTVLWVRMVKIKPQQPKTDDDFMFENAPYPPETLLNEFSELQRLYPNKRFKLLQFYLYDEPHEHREYDLSPEVHICEMRNDESFGWKGDMSAIAEVLQKYELSFWGKFRYAVNTFKFKSRRLLLRIAALCGSQRCRKLLKKKD